MIALDPFYVKMAAYFGAALCMGLGAVGAALGEGYTAGRAILGINRQPAEGGNILRTMLIGQAIAETSGIFALMVAVFLVFTSFTPTLPKVFGLVGAGLATGLAGLGTGVGAGIVSAQATFSMARQPETISRETLTMLIGQAVSQSTTIYALLVSLILIFAV